jgi:predicted N-formylglutamate amidohydrolase
MAAPPDIETFNAEGRAPALLLCDHAGHRVPQRLGDLGLPPGELRRHIGWDIGAAPLTYHIARLLDAPAVLCHISRLVMDVNRPPRHPTAMPVVSDGTRIPANRDLSDEEGRRRLFGSFVPYHRAIARRLARFRREGVSPVLIAVHSFTSTMAGLARPWHIGVLASDDRRLADPLLEALRAEPDLVVGDNEPYSGRDEVGFTMRYHAERGGLPHVMLEVRQDLIAGEAGARAWAERLVPPLRAAMAAG